jgi:hypothetical protein
MYRIQYVGVARTALVFATVLASFYAMLFLILFIFLFVCWTAGGLFVHSLPNHLPSGAEATALLLFVPPLVFVLVSAFLYPFAALYFFLYNQVAKVTGGIEFSIF